MIVHRVPQSDHVGVQIQDKTLLTTRHTYGLTVSVKYFSILLIFFLMYHDGSRLWPELLQVLIINDVYINVHINHSNYNAQIPMQYIVYV